MKKLIMAVLAGFLSLAVAGAYAGEAKGDDKKSDTGMAKSEKGMAKKDAMSKSDTAMSKKDDNKKKGKGKKAEQEDTKAKGGASK
jgi:hypothetical protein